MSTDLGSLDATAQAELVRQRRASPQELVDAAIDRLERVNPRLNAVIHTQLEQARAQAKGALPAGPFTGVPFLMKDIGGPEAGQPCHAGLRFLKDANWRETVDGYFTTKIRQAGLVILGRTNTPELALLPTTEPVAYGATRNPWNPNHSAGGSSGGAAAAVAAGIVPFAHASDGGGSIRGPASMCGLVGLKPTRGRCSFGPAVGERWSGFSAEFAVTRSVRDAAALLDAVAGPMSGDPYSAPLPPRPFAASLAAPLPRLRIGVLRTGLRGQVLHHENAAAIDHATRSLVALGHRIQEQYPGALDDPDHVLHYVTVVSSNTARALDSWTERIGRPIEATDVEPLTAMLADRGRQTTAPELLATIEYVHRFGRQLADWWDSGFDLLLTPTQALPPPPLGLISSTPEEPLRAFLLSAPYGMFTLPFNMSGQPAISLPLHWTGDGLPIGIQLVAASGREDLLLQVAAELEQAVPWRDRKPPIHA